MVRFVRRVIVAALLLIGGAAALASSAQAQTPPLEESAHPSAAVDSVLRDARERYALPAMAAAVVRADTVLAVSVVGVRRAGQPARVQKDDRFHIGSNTKAMTATLMALLVEEGVLAWDTTVGDVFAEYADSTAAAYRDVTLQMLLSHQAGVPPFTAGFEFWPLPPFEGSPQKQREAFARWLLRQGPVHEPDTTFLYSNAGYALATAMAEKATGEPWEAMLRKRLLRPLGIGGVVGWPARADSTQPWGHWTRGGALSPHPPGDAYRLESFVAPAGDLSMSIGDYADFLQLHLRGLRGEETAVLDSTALRYLHVPQAAMGDGADGGSYALGWVVRNLNGVLASSHAGSAGTFYALAAVQPARDLAAVVFANAGNEAAAAASGEALRLLLERYRRTER